MAETRDSDEKEREGKKSGRGGGRVGNQDNWRNQRLSSKIAKSTRFKSVDNQTRGKFQKFRETLNIPSTLASLARFKSTLVKFFNHRSDLPCFLSLAFARIFCLTADFQSLMSYRMDTLAYL